MKFDCGGAHAQVEAAAQFGRVAGCEIAGDRQGEQIRILVPSVVFASPFLAKSVMEESAEPTLDFARLIGRSFVNR